MAYEVRPGQGTLFQADKKSDNGPDVEGYLVLHRDVRAGERIRLAGWRKDTRDGKKMLSLKASDERARGEVQQQRRDPQRPLDDDIPF